VIGDGSATETKVDGNRLQQWGALEEAGLRVEMPKSIEHAKETLQRKVRELDTNGMTALGPGLLISVAMASKVQGSKVILCTDGCANRGLGGLESTRSDEYEKSSQFYSDVITLAKKNGFVVLKVKIEVH
jgi:Mg-chelatase subunit ChlD